MSDALNFNDPIRRDTALLFGTSSAGSGYTVIGFQTDNPGAWLMHCHTIWHSDGGMAFQYLERPAEIDAQRYYIAEFQNECLAMQSYEAQGAIRSKAEYETGARRSVEDAAMSFNGYDGDLAVRT